MPAPIGSIVAYAGPVDTEWETTNGWMACDGRQLDRTNPEYTPLWEAIGYSWGGDTVRRFHVPDLAGYFLRGVDRRKGGRDPDRDTRTEINPGGQKGNNVGSVQDWGTALPARGPQAFVILDSRPHMHGLSFELNATRDVDGQDNTVAYPGPEHQTSPGGVHSHEWKGGHQETRPINAYVQWIIRFK